MMNNENLNITKQDLIKKANEYIENYPKNSSQKFQGYLVSNHLENVIELCKELTSKFKLNLAAGFYMYINDMIEPPKCIDCHINIPRFISFNEGFLSRCKECGIKYSRKILINNTKNKSEETKKKLSEACKKRYQTQQLAKQNYHYIELTKENIDKAYQEAQECVIKNYLQFPMDNLKLNTIRREYPHLIEVVKSLIHEVKVKKPLEGLYWMIHKLSERPHCQLHLDDKCTDIVTFVNLEKGYNEACGQCSKHKPSSSEKARISYKLKTGYDNPAQNPECMKKRGDNYEKKHGIGIRHHLQTQEGRQKVIDAIRERTDGKYDYMVNVPEIKNKALRSLLENHDKVQEKTKNTYLMNHGVERYQSTQDFKDKLRNTIINKPNHLNQILDDIKTIHELYNLEFLKIPKLFKEDVPYKCLVCGNEGIINISRIKSGNTWICPTCHPYHGNQSKAEYDISSIITKELKDEIHEFSNRTILDGKEIDIYYPNRNLAIEYCGSKYHSCYLSSDWKFGCSTISEDYHYQKWLGCKNKNINLITIFEDEWVIAKYRRIAIPLLLSKFNIYRNTINIVDCQIVPIHDKNIVYNFLSDNCLDRFNNYSNSYGVLCNNKIIAMFCYEMNDNYYDIRYCNDKNYNIVNSFTILLEKFKNEYIDKPIRYSINRDWFDCPSNLKDYDFKVIDDNMNLNRFYWGQTLWKRKMFQDFNDKNHEMFKQDKLNWLNDCGNVIYQLDR